MNRDDLIAILCKLKYLSDYKTHETCFLYEFSKRKYKISYSIEDKRLMNFNITDIGEVIDENN